MVVWAKARGAAGAPLPAAGMTEGCGRGCCHRTRGGVSMQKGLRLEYVHKGSTLQGWGFQKKPAPLHGPCLWGIVTTYGHQKCSQSLMQGMTIFKGTKAASHNLLISKSYASRDEVCSLWKLILLSTMQSLRSLSALNIAFSKTCHQFILSATPCSVFRLCLQHVAWIWSCSAEGEQSMWSGGAWQSLSVGAMFVAMLRGPLPFSFIVLVFYFHVIIFKS